MLPYDVTQREHIQTKKHRTQDGPLRDPIWSRRWEIDNRYWESPISEIGAEQK